MPILRHCRSAAVAAIATLILLTSSPARAAGIGDIDAVPALDVQGRADYRAFLEANGHRAFAIAPDGETGAATSQATPAEAKAKALAVCRAVTVQPCHIYAVDDRVVLDAAGWAASWRPSTATEADRAPRGIRAGERFPDVVLAMPDGRPITVSALRGRVVVLHFWGSWCGPCQRELPSLQDLYRALADRPDLMIVPVATREKAGKAQRWAAQHGLALPIYDSGGLGTLPLADGERIADRRLALKFPTSYVLDTNGVVVFAHVGPIERWPDYAPLLIHLTEGAAAASRF